MEFSALAHTLEAMEKTRKRGELTQHLVDLFGKTDPEEIARIVYMIQGKLRPDYEGVELGVADKLAVRAVAKSAGVQAREVEEAYGREGDLGAAASEVLGQKAQTTFVVRDITVERVYDTLVRIAGLEGARSQDMKIKYISSLLNDATPRDARFVLKLLLGTLRLGVAENTVMDALAVAYTGDKANRKVLEAAYNVSSDLGRVAEAASRDGVAGLEGFCASVFSPIRPMLAERVKSGAEAAEKMGGRFVAEYKLDGERVQIHMSGGKIVLFSRSLENITRYYPDIVERIPGAVGADEAILEAEAVAVNEDSGEFLPFQELMHRKRKYGIDKAVAEYPISVNFFDVLYCDGQSCLGMGYMQRRRMLEGIVTEDGYARCVTMTEVCSGEDVEEFMESGINAGCEGLMIKSPDATYQAGARGSNWLKLKREYRNELGDSLDLVVIGAFFGKGRRTGKYGTLLLASYDDESDVFHSICKVGTGFTDEYLDQLYQLLSGRVAVRRNPRVVSGMEPDVWFEPELVIEVVASEITQSPVHVTAKGVIRKEGGLALRFPKFTGRIRQDKAAENASTDREVIALYRGQKRVSSSQSS